MFQSQREWRILRDRGRLSLGSASAAPDALLPASVPEAQAVVTLGISQSELGRLTVGGGSGIRVGDCHTYGGDCLAAATSPTVRNPRNESENARLAGDPSLRARVSVRPQPTCRPAPPVDAVPGSEDPALGSAPAPKLTSADVLEALHQVTGLPIVADFYTRLFEPESVSSREVPLFSALNQLADAMRLRWRKDEAWLQFRSASFYDDRLKEVPNRLLNRWAASRRRHGVLPLEDLLEIAQLTDAQLDANDMAEGARDCCGLVEWDLARHKQLRRDAPFLAQLTPAQRQEAQSTAGLPFQRMTLAQQQQFLFHVPLPKGGEQSLPELTATASLRLEYSQPGWFRRAVPDARNDGPEHPYVGPLAPSPVRERTRDATLLAARRLDRDVPAEQIVPSDLALRLQFTLGRPPQWGSTGLVCVTPHGSTGWGHVFEPEAGWGPRTVPAGTGDASWGPGPGALHPAADP